MNYLDGFSKFIFSQHLATGLKLTLAAIIPCLIFSHYGILDAMISFPLGTLFIAGTDSPGPTHTRRNTLILTILLAFLIVYGTSLLHDLPVLFFFAIICFGMFFSMIGVYGNRGSSVGTISLLIFIITIDSPSAAGGTFSQAIIFAAGGIWYLLLFFMLDKLRPYQHVQQLMGENFVNLGALLTTKSRFYRANINFSRLSDKMLQQQIGIRENQENLREILFRTRQLVSESSNKSRTLMLMFLDSIDLFEQILNSQQDYQKLHLAFGNSKILRVFGTYLSWLGAEVQHIGVAVQAGIPSRPRHDLDESFHKCELIFVRYRETHMTQDNIEDFIMLRQILNSMRDVTQRIKKLHRATRYEATRPEDIQTYVSSDEIAPPQDYHPRLLLDNLSLKSGHFRHSLRLTIALLIGHSLSLFWEIGHSYWILLTIVTIMKPAFSITKQRNLYRMAGTVLGAIAGFLLLYLTDNTITLFACMIIAMIVAHTFLKLNYFVASIGITIYVLLAFSFITPHAINAVLLDRVTDTFIGSAIATIVSLFVLPQWEYQHREGFILQALRTNLRYFDTVAGVFEGKPLDMGALKMSRKNAFIELANLSDTFQRMMSEPKRQRVKLEDFHQFVATSHMLTSYIASLSTYAQTVGHKYQITAFTPRIRKIKRNLGDAADIVEGRYVERTVVIRQPTPQNEQLLEMLASIKKEIRETGREGVRDPSLSRELSELRTIDELFELIYTITIDEVKILNRLF